MDVISKKLIQIIKDKNIDFVSNTNLGALNSHWLNFIKLFFLFFHFYYFSN